MKQPIMLDDDLLVVCLTDRVAGNREVQFTYVLPTTRERNGYLNDQLKRKGRKTEVATSSARLKYGACILRGIRDGDFAVRGKNREIVRISSDPESPEFFPGWKDVVVAKRPHLVEMLCAFVFDGAAALAADSDDEAEEAEAGKAAAGESDVDAGTGSEDASRD